MLAAVRRLLPAFVIVVSLGALMVPVGAQGSGAPPLDPPTTAVAKVSTVEQRLREAYDDASADEAASLDAYQASLDKTTAIDTQIAEIDVAVRVVAGYLEVSRSKVAAAQAELAVGEARRAQVERELTAQRTRLEARAVSAYVSGDIRRAQLEAVLGAHELRDLESTRAYTSAIVDDQLDALALVRVLQGEATALRDRLAANEQAIRAEGDAIAKYDADLVAKRTAAGALRDAQVAESARAMLLVADIRSRKQYYLDRLGALERESDGITFVLRAAQKNQQPVFDLPLVRTPLEKPVTIESPFGRRLHPVFQELRMHTGVDFDGTAGQPVRAAAAGLVVFAAIEDGYGNVVVIDHGNQIATVYAHMLASSVKLGDVLARGQVLGTVGSTGYSTGPHLHFEYRVSGAAIDPVPHVDFDEPLPGSCEALARSKDPADLALFLSRSDCAPPATTTTTTTRTTTTTPRPSAPSLGR